MPTTIASSPADAVAALSDRVFRLEYEQARLIAVSYSQSDVANAACKKAMAALTEAGLDWRGFVKEVQTSATHAYRKGERNPLVHNWLWSACQGAALAVAAADSLTEDEYRVLVAPVAKLFPALFDGPLPPTQNSREEPTMPATPTVAKAEKPTRKPAANKPRGITPPKGKAPALRAGKPKPEAKPVPTSDHAVAEKHAALAKEKGVKIVRNPGARGGAVHAVIEGTLLRALSGAWDDPQEAKRAVEAAGYSVTKVVDL